MVGLFLPDCTNLLLIKLFDRTFCIILKYRQREKIKIVNYKLLFFYNSAILCIDYWYF